MPDLFAARDHDQGDDQGPLRHWRDNAPVSGQLHLAGDAPKPDVVAAAARVVTFEVLGSPAPKGSAQAFVIGGKARVVTGGSKGTRARMKAWDGSVREAALEQLGERTEPVFVQVALSVLITFRMARPQGHWGTKGLKASAPAHPSTKPDIDKLARTTLDAMTGLVFDDDSRIAQLILVKTFAQPGREGASIRVEAL